MCVIPMQDICTYLSNHCKNQVYSYLNHCLMSLGNLIYSYKHTLTFSSGSGSSAATCLLCDFGKNNSLLLWIQVYSYVKQARLSWRVLLVLTLVYVYIFKPVEDTWKMQRHKLMENQVSMDYFDRQVYWPYYLVKVVGKGVS